MAVCVLHSGHFEQGIDPANTWSHHPLQLQEDIVRLATELAEKEEELTEVKKALGITPFTEFKQSMAQSWKVVGDKWKEVQETET